MSSITKAMIMTGDDSGPDYINMPLTFKALEANSKILLFKGSSVPSRRFQYRTSDKGAWSDYTPSTELTLANEGDIVQFQNLDESLNNGSESYSYCFFISNSGSFEAYGNILSMLNWMTGPLPTYAFSGYDGLFNQFNRLKYAHNLYICKPDTDLSSNLGQFNKLFRNCTGLITPPKLPINRLAEYCYREMFNGCSSLSVAPVLSATTLAQSCYSNMFNGCSSLSAAPELPATTLANWCCHLMFQGCTGLSAAPELPATTLAQSCYYGMFNGCTSLSTAPALPATTLAIYCYRQMFQGCTGLSAAPELPATTLSSSCYRQMFQGCSNLNSIKVGFTAWNPSNATTRWVDSVAASGTFICDSNLPQTRGVNNIPENWTISII